MRECEWCGRSIVRKNSQAKFCSSKCRVYAHRASENPLSALRNRRRWVLYDEQKRPRTLAGSLASSTDPETWSTRAALARHTNIGYVLGEGVGCIDLDHCLIAGKPTPAAREYLTRYPRHYIEISPSGDGLHIWGTAAEAPGTKRTVNGLSVETYTTGRYITVTGKVFQKGQMLPL